MYDKVFLFNYKKIIYYNFCKCFDENFINLFVIFIGILIILCVF